MRCSIVCSQLHNNIRIVQRETLQGRLSRHVQTTTRRNKAMKHIMIFAAVLSMASVAHADPVSVATPKAPVSAEDAATYVASLDKAVKQVCRESAGPIVGVAVSYTHLTLPTSDLV